VQSRQHRNHNGQNGGVPKFRKYRHYAVFQIGDLHLRVVEDRTAGIPPFRLLRWQTENRQHCNSDCHNYERKNELLLRADFPEIFRQFFVTLVLDQLLTGQSYGRGDLERRPSLVEIHQKLPTAQVQQAQDALFCDFGSGQNRLVSLETNLARVRQSHLV
jgi:hypothetical protein